MKKSCRTCRKFGTKLFLKGERCLGPKCSFTRRNYGPGMQGAKGKVRRKSEYALELLEKQKAKQEYGLREKQFVRFFRLASRGANTGEKLLILLEMRLDNVVYRLGWAPSRSSARQLVLHRKIKLNNKIANIPSMLVKPEDNITPSGKIVNEIKAVVPGWLKATANKAEVLDVPQRKNLETDIDEEKILEFYSR